MELGTVTFLTASLQGDFHTRILKKGQLLGLLAVAELEQRLKHAPCAGYGPCCGHCVIVGNVAVPSRLLESMGYCQFGCTVVMQIENQNGREVGVVCSKLLHFTNV